MSVATAPTMVPEAGQAPYNPQNAGAYQAAPPAYVQPAGYGSAADVPGPLDDWARKLPDSAAGTVFGRSVDLFADVNLRNMVLLVLGALLCASIFVPVSTVFETQWAWSKSSSKFGLLIFPILAGAFYIATARNVIQHALLGAAIGIVALVGILSMGGGDRMFGSNTFFFGFAALLFGLMARLAHPNDMVPRVIMAVGSLFWLVFLIDAVEFIFTFEKMPALMVIHNLLFFVVLLAGIICGALVVPANKMPPALRPLEAFAPLLTAIVVGWVIVQPLLLTIGLISATTFGNGLVMGIRLMIVAGAYFGVWTLAAPSVYKILKEVLDGSQASGGQGGQYGQQGGQPGQSGPYGGPPGQGGSGGWQQ